jgi:hypothetical protein
MILGGGSVIGFSHARNEKSRFPGAEPAPGMTMSMWGRLNPYPSESEGRGTRSR